MIWILKKAFYRIYHGVMRLIIQVIKFPPQEIISGEGSEAELPVLLLQRGCRSVLVVTDDGLMKLGLLSSLFSSLDENDLKYTVYDAVPPNPAIDDIEAGLAIYLENQCDSVIGFGGGSPMDCAKVIAARAANPKQTVRKMRGLFKVRRRPVPIVAIPTTAGTGSETTVAAIITDMETHEKFAISDTKLVPRIVIFNPDLTLGLPPHITAATGLDALTHAVEAYIGLHDIAFVKQMAEEAVGLIFDNLETVYRDGSDRDGREKMLRASYCGGAAFTRASVGYTHAIAHNLGGLYGVAHGLGNAVLLPAVLDFCRESCETKLAALARAGKIGEPGDSDFVLSTHFINEIRELNKRMGIPETIDELKAGDIPLIAERAVAEANPSYPVPRIMNEEQCEEILNRMTPRVSV